MGATTTPKAPVKAAISPAAVAVYPDVACTAQMNDEKSACECADGEKHGDDRYRERAIAEYPNIDDGMCVGDFPRDEGKKRDTGNCGGGRYEARAEPVVLLAVVEYDLQRANPDDQKREPDKVDGIAHSFSFFVPQGAPSQQRANNRDGNIEIEDPPPADRIGNDSTKPWTRNRRAQGWVVIDQRPSAIFCFSGGDTRSNSV